MRDHAARDAFVLRIDAVLRRAGIDPSSRSFLVFTGGIGGEFVRFLRARHALSPRHLPDGAANEDEAAVGAPLGLFEFDAPGGPAHVYADVVPETFGPGLFVAAAGPRGSWGEDLRREFLASRSRTFEGTRFLYKNSRWVKFEPDGARWGDIVLDPALQADLRGNLDHFFGAKPFFDRNRLPHRRGFLLCGPPGNGKTLLLRVLAGEYPGVAFAVFAEGQAHPDDEDLDAFFDDCPLAPSVPRIVVFEDLDSLFGEQRISLAHFLNRIDGLTPLAGCLILATTNRPEAIDPALLRRPSRFDRVWRLGDPPYAQRRSYLRRLLGEDGARLRETIDEAARDTEGFSFAMLREVFLSAGVLAHAAKAASLESAHLRIAVERMREQDAFTRKPGERTPDPVGFRFGLEEPVGEATAGTVPATDGPD